MKGIKIHPSILKHFLKQQQTLEFGQDTIFINVNLQSSFQHTIESWNIQKYNRFALNIFCPR